MRPTNKRPGAVWLLLDAWSKEHEYGPFRQSKMAEMFGVSVQLVSNWKYGESAVQPSEVALIHEKTGIDIGLLAAAVAADVQAKKTRGEQVEQDSLEAAAENVSRAVKARRQSRDEANVREDPPA